MQGGLPEWKGPNEEVPPGEADGLRGHVGTTAPGGGASKAGHQQEKGHRPMSSIILMPHLLLLFPPHILVLTPGSLPLCSLYSCLQLSVPSQHQVSAAATMC